MIDSKYQGFVLSKVDYKDNDAIITILTKDGKVVFGARGILKPTSKNASSCNYFMVSEYVVSSKTESSNKTLKTASLVKMYKLPYVDLKVSAIYLFICSLLNKVDDLDGYDLALDCFNKLESNEDPIDVLNYFLKHFVIGLGYKPNLQGCVLCNKKSELVSFDLESGGYICKSCFDLKLHKRYTSSYLKELLSFLKNDEFVNISNVNKKELLNMYINFIENVACLSIRKDVLFLYQCL